MPAFLGILSRGSRARSRKECTDGEDRASTAGRDPAGLFQIHCGLKKDPTDEIDDPRPRASSVVDE
mgnify:CR=1 FL=1